MEQSFGVIPIALNGEAPCVFIIQNYSQDWLMPKGHSVGIESPMETAQRELFEETGLKIAAWLPYGPFSEEYTFIRFNKPVHKQVEYFPALVEGEIAIQKEEIKEGRWVLLKDLEREVSFPELKAIARQLVCQM